MVGALCCRPPARGALWGSPTPPKKNLQNTNLGLKPQPGAVAVPEGGTASSSVAPPGSAPCPRCLFFIKTEGFPARAWAGGAPRGGDAFPTAAPREDGQTSARTDERPPGAMQAKALARVRTRPSPSCASGPASRARFWPGRSAPALPVPPRGRSFVKPSAAQPHGCHVSGVSFSPCFLLLAPRRSSLCSQDPGGGERGRRRSWGRAGPAAALAASGARAGEPSPPAPRSRALRAINGPKTPP